MKPRVKVKVQFGKVARPALAAASERVARVARLLALAHAIDERIRAGELEDLADAARELGLTRARVTQLMNLALLSPAIQAAVLDGAEVTERMLRKVVAEPNWSGQMARWRTTPSGRAA